MRKPTYALMLLVGIVVGCAANRVLVSTVRADEPRRWEYACFDQQGEKDVAKMANGYGQQGWELVTSGVRSTPDFTLATWCFKRPLP
jgi:hypothetical protein